MLLGDSDLHFSPLPGMEELVQHTKTSLFEDLSFLQKLDFIGEALVKKIEAAPDQTFLLPSFLQSLALLPQYTFSYFEWWLIQRSALSEKEQQKIRFKLSGRNIPRQAYQALFPIGMDKYYAGPHFVSAHTAPDLDTTVASFWGWVDAFSARLTRSVHLWNVPGPFLPQSAEIDLLFYKPFGASIFKIASYAYTSLSLSSLELVEYQENWLCSLAEPKPYLEIDQPHKVLLLTSKEGEYIGEWKESDVEPVRSTLNLFNQVLRWYENHLHSKLILLLSSTALDQIKFVENVKTLFSLSLKDSAPVREFSSLQRHLLSSYLQKVFGMSKGIESSFYEATLCMEKAGIISLLPFKKELQSSLLPSLFNHNSYLTQNSSSLLQSLSIFIERLDLFIHQIRSYVDELKVAYQVKKEVLLLPSASVHLHADLEEIQRKIKDSSFISVTAKDEKGRLFPVGIIPASKLYESTLGTVSLRDFGNREETKIPSYLEIISIIDHHKSNFNTSAAASVIIGDVQSCNVLTAQKSFAIHDMYSTGGMHLHHIEEQISSLQNLPYTPSQGRKIRKLLHKKAACCKKEFFISPEREKLEYLHYLYAILDDTDLLAKSSWQDIYCVAELLNRLKTLFTLEEVEIVHFDDLEENAEGLKVAVQRLLSNPDLYSLYKKIYEAKEKALTQNIHLCAKGEDLTLFADTKEQNECCKVGQTKLFAANWTTYEQYALAIRKKWIELCQETATHKPLYLFLHMMSTIGGAEELHKGEEQKYAHLDELWIWVPPTEIGQAYLKSFLSKFQEAPNLGKAHFQLYVSQNSHERYRAHFQESFPTIPCKAILEEDIALLRFTPGLLNSRKAMISPYLPKAKK